MEMQVATKAAYELAEAIAEAERTTDAPEVPDGAGVMPEWAERELETVRDPRMRAVLRRLWTLVVRTQAWLRQQGYGSWADYERDQHEERMFHKMLEIGVPERHAIAQIKGSSPTEAMRAVVEFLGKPGQCLVLSGPPGVGKTWAAAAFARALLERGEAVMWVYAGELFGQFTPATSRTSDYTHIQALVVDDLGAEDAPGVRGKMDSLIYHRHGRILTTLITTNLSVDRLRDRYGDRVLDRLAEWGQIVEISGRSMRGGLYV